VADGFAGSTFVAVGITAFGAVGALAGGCVAAAISGPREWARMPVRPMTPARAPAAAMATPKAIDRRVVPLLAGWATA
jgi:hypothetical protein